jgi:hypothetical protein
VLTIGVDPHKRLNVAIALDDRGQNLSSWTGPNTSGGWEAILAWATDLGPDRQWGVEGAWSYGRGLAQHLVDHGETVYEVNPRWTAQGRRRARRMDKTDLLDAHAVATWVWKEGDTLHQVAADDETVLLDLLVTQRRGHPRRGDTDQEPAPQVAGPTRPRIPRPPAVCAQLGGLGRT